MFPSVSSLRLSSGAGIGEVEARISQLENKITSFEAPDNAFGSVLSQSASIVAGAANAMTGSLKERFAALQPIVEKYATQYGVDKNLVNAVIKQESGFNAQAVSHSGAQGLMQLMPATAKGLGVANAFDPAQNVQGGVKHLRGLLDRYHGNIPLALAAYNAGGGAVAKHNGIPPYAETQNYVKKVLGTYLAQNAK